MKVSPCAFAMLSLLLIVGSGVIYAIFDDSIRLFFRWINRMEFYLPDVQLKVWQKAKWALPIVLLFVLFSHIQWVDCKTHQPIVSVKDCGCENLIAKK
jgi:hypothetical protein